MDGRDDITRTHDMMFQRIVALLFALADIAERASRRGRFVRWLIVWILRPAEAVATSIVGDKPGYHAPLMGSDSAIDALRLALRFRTIARRLIDLPSEHIGMVEWRLSTLSAQAADLSDGSLEFGLSFPISGLLPAEFSHVRLCRPLWSHQRARIPVPP